MKNYEKVLVIAVGGGNDSVSTILLQEQLKKSFGYDPKIIDIIAVLPDCLDYKNLKKTHDNILFNIESNSKRFVDDKEIEAFPEKILSKNKKSLPSDLNVRNVLGLSMEKGSIGIADSLKRLVKKELYDLVLSVDVGGDFIADKANIEVLSPMMDGYMLYALKQLTSFIEKENLNTKTLFSIFGLGTDGESTPEMLDKALSNIKGIKTYNFKKDDVKEFISFYRNTVEKNRYARTTDYTLLEILNLKHDNPSSYRARFHIKTYKNMPSKKYYGYFTHTHDERHYGKFYIFDSIDNVYNNYSEPSISGVDWFLKVQNNKDKINHELNGQCYNNLSFFTKDKIFDKKSLFFCTPSRKFSKEQQLQIINDLKTSLYNDIYDIAFIYSEYKELLNINFNCMDVNEDLCIVGKDIELLEFFKSFLLRINNV